METPNRADGFGPYFKRYTKTWQHAVATAALTAFGMLTFVDKLFAIVAISAYVLPPLVLYVRRSPSQRAPSPDEPGDDPSEDAGESRAEESATPDAEPAESTSHEGATPTPEAETPTPEWRLSSVPTDATLLDAAVTPDGAYAVGADGTLVGTDGDDWTELLADGPRAGSNALRGVAAVEEGGVWVAGENGALGRLDPATGRHVDYSAPEGDSSNLVDVAVAGSGGDGADGAGSGDAGSAGDETLLVVNGSGEVRRGRYRDGDLRWADPVTPGSGSSLAGVALADESAGYACDTSQSVFETTDGGRSFEEVGAEAEGTLTDVATTGLGACMVSADDGAVHRYDGDRWTPERVADESVLAVALDGGRGLACGEGGVYEREGAGGWERETTPAMGALRGVALGASRAVAVGDDGTVVERGLSSDK